jgi:hypothetical protein
MYWFVGREQGVTDYFNPTALDVFLPDSIHFRVDAESSLSALTWAEVSKSLSMTVTIERARDAHVLDTHTRPTKSHQTSVAAVQCGPNQVTNLFSTRTVEFAPVQLVSCNGFIRANENLG